MPGEDSSEDRQQVSSPSLFNLPDRIVVRYESDYFKQEIVKSLYKPTLTVELNTQHSLLNTDYSPLKPQLCH
jgi:hypothetical protein